MVSARVWASGRASVRERAVVLVLAWALELLVAWALALELERERAWVSALESV